MKIKLFGLSIIIWLIPFLFRLMTPSHYYYVDTQALEKAGMTKQLSTMDSLLHYVDNNEREQVFLTIAKNNLKGCFINIAGGCMMGVVSVVNLSFNGFFSAGLIKQTYQQGIPFRRICELTIPHSFELIGFWWSGAIGLYIASQIFKAFRGKETDTKIYRFVGFGLLMVILIIIAAAFVEAYITMNFL